MGYVDEFVQGINEKEVLADKSEKTVVSRPRETFKGTVAIKTAAVDTKVTREQLNQYIEECSDGSLRCTLCGKTSGHDKGLKPKRGNMQNHIETHLDGTSYDCSICQKVFRSKNSLSNHKSVF